ncbi:MAG: Cna B-type domain-containing protein [Atopobiaceae bacterium]|nr:Cna B-type domain-containing protein [Atopobiaceae bacterium]MCI2174241.1 Cna B-type domain-containing protein [Atopobiaceae bacterium]MCI2206882.1 Cna B-type domain-containing protein [Atopobiaceae bacterium]
MKRFDTCKLRGSGGVARVLVALVTVFMLCVMGTTSAFALSEPTHTKTVTANSDGTYDLSLSVTGDSESSQTTDPADIVIVLDHSGSMTKKMHGASGSRWKVAKSAISQIADSILTEDNAKLDASQQARISLVTFGDTASVDVGYTTNASDIMNAGVFSDDYTPTGGTNWEDSLLKANTQVNSGREGVKKYIIFLSDGDPTFRDSSCGDNNDDRWSTPWGIHGSGNSDPHNWNYNSAKNAANARPAGTTLFSVAVSTDAAGKMNNFATDTTTKTSTSTYLNGTSSTDLDAAVKTIINSIKSVSTYKNVSVDDTLSDYASFAEASPTFTATKTSKGKTETIANPDVTVDGKSVTWDLSKLGNNGKLESGTTYTLTFKITPSDAAYQKYATDGSYPSTGDEGTGASSAGKPGFYSNADESAKLNYTSVKTINGKDQPDDPATTSYARPVIQCSLTSASVSKNWDDSNNNAGLRPSSVTMQLQKTVNGQTSDVQGKTLTLTANSGWTGTIDKLPVSESGHDITYSFRETNVPSSYTATTSGSTITNTLKTGALSIEKSVISSEGTTAASNATFTFKVDLKSGNNKLGGSYKYTIYDSDGSTIKTGTISSGGTVQLLATQHVEITGIPAGVRYTVTEQNNPGGFENTSKSNDKGSIPVGSTAACSYTNTYTAKPVDVDILATVEKILTGRDWSDTDSFTFKLTAATTSAPMPSSTTLSLTKSNLSGGSAKGSFGKVTYTVPGEYTYNIKEDAGSLGGITYDDHTATVTVKVSDDAMGYLHASITTSGLTFTNKYGASKTVDALRITKTLSGHDMAAGDFQFTVKPQDQASATKADIDLDGKTVSNTAASDGQTVTMDPLGQIAFNEKDIGQTFTYAVSETKGGGDGYSNDGTVYTVSMKVQDAGGGNLKIVTTVSEPGKTDVTYTNSPATVAFKNGYSASGTLGSNGTVSIDARKQLVNHDLSKDEFSFYVANSAGTKVATATNAASGAITFSDINYTTDSVKADVAAKTATQGKVDDKDVYTYVYTVSEDTTNLPAGVTATTSSFQITVTLVDDGAGHLLPTVAYPVGTSSLQFVNTYSTNNIEIDLAGKKTVDHTSAFSGPGDITGMFTFKIATDDGVSPEKTTATTDQNGTVDFGKVKFTLQSLGGAKQKTFDYTVTEVEGHQGGISYDTTPQNIAITVTDDGKGNLSYTIDPAQSPYFSITNKYSASPASDTIKATKSIDGRDLKDGEFTFQLVDANDEVVASGTNDANGNVTIDGLSFDSIGSYSYTLKEVAGDTSKGVTYDGTTYTVTVNVIDDGKGALTASNVITDADGNEVSTPSFNNSYETTPTSASFGATKVLSGRTLNEGEFGFTLSSSDGTPMPEVTNVSNGADGSVSFGAIEYEAKGEYDYTISEDQGSIAGVTYDGTTYRVHVSVTDDGVGHLVAAVSYPDGTPVFNNSYVPSPVTVSGVIKGTKTLTGAALTEGEFSFVLTDSAGGQAATATNKADGSVTFSDVTYTEAGTYDYVATEVAGTDAKFTYDTASFKVRVTVSDDGNGKLTAEVSYPDGAPTWNNVYTDSSSVVIPQTGDGTTGAGFLIALLAVAGIAICSGSRMRRNER